MRLLITPIYIVTIHATARGASLPDEFRSSG
jgi:hypothetical protein